MNSISSLFKKKSQTTIAVTLGDVWMYKWKNTDSLFPYWYDDKEKVASIDPDEIILEPNKKYVLIIDYPLSREFVQPIDTIGNGMSRKELVSLITQCYKLIYKDEEETTSIEPTDIPGMLNRITTNGAYGIWGHNLSDLILHTVYIDGNNVIRLGVDS